MKRLLKLKLILVLFIAIYGCQSSTRKIVIKRNQICKKDLRIPEKLWEIKSIEHRGKIMVEGDAMMILIDHAEDLAACLRATQCVTIAREKQLECAEKYIDKMRGSILPWFQIRKKCRMELECIPKVLDDD